MLPFSEITLVGNLGHDPSTEYTKNGTMNVSFSVAVTKRGRGSDGEDLTNWYRVTAWGKLAETMDNLANEGALRKGSQVLIMGDLTVREYTKRDGDNGYALEINARSVNIASGRERAERGEDDEHTY